MLSTYYGVGAKDTRKSFWGILSQPTPYLLGGCWTKISERWDWRPFYPGMNHATDTPSCVRWRPSPLEREGIGAGLISDPSHTFRESGYGMGTTAMAFLAGMEISFENNSTSLRPRYRCRGS